MDDNSVNIGLSSNRAPKLDSVAKLISNFLITRSIVFHELSALRDEVSELVTWTLPLKTKYSVGIEADRSRKGWNNPEGDKHFEKQRNNADEATKKTQIKMYHLMQLIGDEIQAATGALSLPEQHAEVLDICMAPGGYSTSALKYSPHAFVAGITLPYSLGGHQVRIPYGRQDPRVEVLYADITMLAEEYGVRIIPADHPDVSKFSAERPWASKEFDLVFCDGQVLRTHATHRARYRERCEAGRLACSQLILAMQRMKPGGTLVMLLHKVEMWQTMKLLSIFDKISQLQLFKPMTCHKPRGSFYLIAKHVQPLQQEALAAVNEWKMAWKEATFPVNASREDQDRLDRAEKNELNKEVSRLLIDFGERLIEIGEPVWQIQKDALREASWFKKKGFKVLETDAKQAEVKASSVSAGVPGTGSMMADLQTS